MWYFRFFKFSIFIANIAILLNLFRFYWKYLNIVLSLFFCLLGENKSVYSNKLLPFKMKSINAIQNNLLIIKSYASTL